MFSFGIFASHTPFLIMAGLYLFYMLISFGMKAGRDEEDVIKDENKTITQQLNESVVDQNTVLELRSSVFQNDDFDQAVDHQKVHLKLTLSGNIIKWPQSHGCVPTFLDYHLFSRPPPARA
ncbi:MAG: hypothetical protein K9G67_13100 [Bacteroidales bacterium]|nr:hypothetical protein [Bacteroidales bacterium]MCF8344315.1 hypothetical protein [Bacteroidales bacterium]MCF8377287.1 hypothetical protein [Bacteroidales bacterium]MCF8401409.1 hypothetical protein [Bacteroidales bacterium]